MNYLSRISEIYKNLPLPAKASFWFLICSFLQKAISTITTPIFTRLLSVSEYGQYSIFNSWLQILTPIICLNLFSGVYSQGIVKFESDRNRFSSSLQGLCLTLSLIWFLVYCLIKDFWNSLFSLNTTQLISMFIIIWVTASFNFWSMDQRVDFKYKNLVLLTLISSILQPIVSIILIVNSEDKVTARIVGIAIVQLVLYIGTFIYQMIKGKTFFSRRYWSYALKFNVPLLPHYLSLTLLSSSDRIMISNMVGAEEAGIYNLAYSISMIMSMFNTALLQSIEPWIYRKLKERNPQDIAKIAYPSFILIAGINLVLILFAPEIVSFFAPKEYQEAIWSIPAVTLSVFFTYLYTFFATFEFYFEKTNYIAGATIIGAIINIVLNFIFINIFGYIAAGYTTLFSYILFAICHYYFMQKICDTYLEGVHPYNLKFIIWISILSVVIGFMIMFTYDYILVRYSLVLICIVIMIYFRHKIFHYLKYLLHLKNI